MMRERGFIVPVWGYLVLAIVVLGMLYGLLAWVDNNWETSAGVRKGEAFRQAEWDAANRQAETDEKERQAAITAALLDEQKLADAADRRADDSHTLWKEAQRDARRKGTALAVCAGTPEPQPSGGDSGGGLRAPPSVAPAGDPGIRLTWGGLRLYDAAWTGSDGKPVYPTPAGSDGTAGPGAASPYRLDDLVDVHGINAERCSADRRDYRALINRIRAAEAAWGRDAAAQ